MTLEDLSGKIHAAPFSGKRRLVALFGPPASGKSTLARTLAKRDRSMQVVPMDGFHLDNALLSQRGLLARKGAPDSFDVSGFLHLVRRLKTENDVVFPIFDRSLDKAIAGADVIRPETRTILIEGNYLMLDRPLWRDLRLLWDCSIKIEVGLEVLRQRLLQRWIGLGYSRQDATQKVDSNDLPNATLVVQNSLPSDVVIAEDWAYLQPPTARTE